MILRLNGKLVKYEDLNEGVVGDAVKGIFNRHELHKSQYDDALEQLHKHKTENPNTPLRNASQKIAKRYVNVNDRELHDLYVKKHNIQEDIRETFEMVNEIAAVNGYRPVGMHEFMQVFSNPNVPQEDKDNIVKYSDAHAKDPKAGHDQKVAEIFKKHGIDLSNVVPKGAVVTKTMDVKESAGAGEEGTEKLLKNYTKNTPNQKKIKSFKQYHSD